MRSVLGIDAAWTLTQPSGCALIVETETGWRVAACEPSYGHFIGEPTDHPRGTRPDPAALMEACRRHTGRTPDLVAIDMPLSLTPITGRRASDNAISRFYGSRAAGTHSPSAVRPGPISDALRAGFAAEGFELLTTSIRTPGLLEVYPHPALIELMEEPRRLPYKRSKTRIYWPGLPQDERRARLANVWQAIIARLDQAIEGAGSALPMVATGPLPKDTEDMLDAIVCAHVGTLALQGRACPYGDEVSAIWCPFPRDPRASAVTRNSDRR